MGKPSRPEESLLFVGTLYKEEEYLSVAREKLVKHFGEIVSESTPLPWDYSRYYEEEMGRPIRRVFIFFGNPIDPAYLAEIKHTTNEIEQELAAEGRRNVNLDPGYQTRSKIVLASTKNYSHRIYIGKGIFAEATLVYVDGKYRPHLFTYRDYASKEYAEIFENSRKMLGLE